MDKYLIKKKKNHVEGNCKLYIFTCFLIIIVVVVVVFNIQIFLFIRLCNLYLLKNTLKKILGDATVSIRTKMLTFWYTFESKEKKNH